MKASKILSGLAIVTLIAGAIVYTLTKDDGGSGSSGGYTEGGSGSSGGRSVNNDKR